MDLKLLDTLLLAQDEWTEKAEKDVKEATFSLVV